MNFSPTPAPPQIANASVANASTLPRAKFLGFAADQDSAAMLETAFAPVLNNGCVQVAGFRKSLGILSRIPCPETLLIDISGEDQPLNAIQDLADMVEPGTTVLVIGPPREIGFYRNVVNGMGIREYIAKPLTPASITSLILPHLQPDTVSLATPAPTNTGKIIAVTGVRGGVGTTTIATNLAWTIGHDMHRHTILLDTNLQTGTAALALNIGPSHGFAAALQAPDRMDAMLIERVAQPAGNRLHLMAGQEPIANNPTYPAGAVTTLTKALLSRFKFVIADTGTRQLPFARDVLALAHQHIIILEPSMMSLRNYERLTASQSPYTAAPILILNQAGRPYGLSTAFMEQAINTKFDCIIPNLPNIIPQAEKFGHMPATTKGPFHDALTKLARQLETGTTSPSTKMHANA